MTRRTPTGWLVGAAVAGLTARVAYRALRRTVPGGAARWERTNHRGRSVTLLEGPALAAGLAAGALMTPGVSGRQRVAAAIAVAGAGVLGAYDDLMGGTASKGFRGHLGALRDGEVTSGAVKIAGIGASGLLAGALVSKGPVDALIGGAVVAGSANLLNLLDLRPGRALKAGILGSVLLAGYGAGAAAPAGAAVALLPVDLGEVGMLGDCGANALGAALGVTAAARLTRAQRLTLLGMIVALTAASEKISFTAVIERNRVLRAVDMLGRQPVET